MKKSVAIIISVGLAVSVIINFAIYFNLNDSLKSEKHKTSRLKSEVESLENDLDNCKEINDNLYDKINQQISQIGQLNDQIRAQQIRKRQNSRITYITLMPLNLYSNFQETSAVLTTIPKGEEVYVEDSFFSHMWKVTYNGQVGWILNGKDDMSSFPNKIPTLRRKN